MPVEDFFHQCSRDLLGDYLRHVDPFVSTCGSVSNMEPDLNLDLLA